VGFVLLIACANVTHMLLARSAERQKEIALRTALGARRWDMVRQFLTESLTLALIGGAAGLLLAFWSIRALLTLGPASMPRVESVSLDIRVLLFALSISTLTGLIFGIGALWKNTGVALSEALKQGERGSSGGRARLSSLLVASEFALAVVLLAGAGLMVRTLLVLQRVDPGFDPHNVLSMVVGVDGTDESALGRTGNFYQEVLQRTESVPGVRSVSAINHLPLAGDQWGLPFYMEGRPATRPAEALVATYRVVFPRYFQTMRIPILRGRDVAESDDMRANPVVIVNQFLAERYWAGENPIGKRISLNDPTKPRSWLTVVGVVKNTVQSSWASPPAEEIFLPFLQSRAHVEAPTAPFAYMTLVARTNGDPAEAVPAIRNAVHSLNKDVPLSEVQTMDGVVAEATAESRFYVVLLGSFATVALVLASVGIYGVMTYSISRRTREIGIRMALGAQRRDVLQLIVFRGMLPVIAGVGAGVGGAFVLTRLMASLLYGIKPSDPVTFVSVLLILGGVAVAACYLPGRRATRVNPVVALRNE
jgi:putative ABC transport system permease protein